MWLDKFYFFALCFECAGRSDLKVLCIFFRSLLIHKPTDGLRHALTRQN